MDRLLLHYTVRPEARQEHLQLLRAVYEELEHLGPDDFSWVTYQLEEENEFLEVATAPALPGPLPELATFRAYRAGLEERCSDRSVSSLEVVGAYGHGGLVPPSSQP